MTLIPMTLQSPHSGYHWNGRQQPFFEGWYYRLTLPPNQTPRGQTIAFMYSLQDPTCGSVAAKTQASGGAVQILGPDEQYFCRSLPDVSRFWACKDRLGHGQSRASTRIPVEGYRVTATLHEGQFWDPSSAQIIRWRYRLEPVYSWGAPNYPQQSTAGWLSQFQIFEPGWQVLMAHGWATGWFEWGDRGGGLHPTHRLDFQRVPAYAEKNWGGAFPKQWFWIQCNAFDNEPDLTLTSGGGIRRVLGWEESVGMVGIHHQGRFYEFVPWNGRVSWQVSSWGSWSVWAEQGDYAINLVGKTAEAGVQVRVPTAAGLEFLCRDTTRGQLSVKLWQTGGRSNRLILSASSQQAGLEVGGEEWTEVWQH